MGAGAGSAGRYQGLGGRSGGIGMRLGGSRGLERRGLDMGRGSPRGPSEARAGCRLGGSLGPAARTGERGLPGQADEGPGPAGSSGREGARRAGRGWPPGRRGAAGPGEAPGWGSGCPAPRPGARSGCGETHLGPVRGGACLRPARPRRRGSARSGAAAGAQAAAAARPPSCSGSPRGALPRRGARSCTRPGRRGRAPASGAPGGAGRGARGTASGGPRRSDEATPQEGPLVWGKPSFQPELRGCGCPQSPWERGRGRTGDDLIGFEPISSSQIASPAAYHRASSCAITLPVLWVLEALRFPESPRKLPTPPGRGNP